MRRLQIMLILIAAAAVLVGPQALARSSEQLENVIRSAISQLHPFDTPKWWRALGPEAPPVIISMAEHSGSTYERTRLVGALAWFPDDESAVDFLKQEADRAPDEITRTKAITALGVSQGAKELDFISRHLTSPDPAIRVASARAIAEMDDPDAKLKLRQFLAAEKDPGVSQAVQGIHPPAHPLKPVSSSEDRINPELEGSWSGFWIAPRKEGGLGEARIELSIKIAGDRITAELRLPKKNPVKLTDVHARGSRIDGTLTAPLPEAAFSGSLQHQAGTTLLELPVPSVGGMLILRKDAAK